MMKLGVMNDFVNELHEQCYIGSTVSGPLESLTPEQQNSAYQNCLGSIAQGDEMALADLYDATLGKVYGLALRITGLPESAEEVVEDVYMQVWHKAHQYQPDRGRVTTWLLTICRSRALDYLRRVVKTESHCRLQSMSSESPASDKDPMDLLSALQANSLVYAVLEGLPSLQRQLISLAFFRDMSHQQLADHLQMPLGTVKTHLRKSLSVLQQAILEHENRVLQ